MATVVNDRDVLIMGTSPRYTPPTDRGMFLTPSTAVFKLSADGLSASPSSFQFVATLLNMTGTVTWSTTGGISLVTNGNTATLNFASFTAVSGTITANITVDGQLYTQTATVTKLADGAQGQQGSRGNVDISAVTSGSIWSDSEAAAALAAAGYGAPQVRDLVNLYRADRTFSAQRMYNGSAWIAVDYVWNGNVFVKGSILPEALDTRGLIIRDANGNPTFNGGASLASQTAVNPNLIPRLTSWPSGSRYNSASVYTNFNGHPAINGELIGIPGSNGSYMGVESGALGIQPNVYYTVSFDAHCYNGSRDINVDLYGTNVDTAGIYVPLTGTPTRYSFTEVITAAQAPQARLRVFGGGAGGASSSGTAEIYNIKVEIGRKQTAWCDNVITRANASTWMQAAAMDFAFIDTATIANLSVVSQLVGLLRTATSGARTEIADNVIKMFADNNQKTLHLGDSTK